jgi:TonB family protein
MSSERPPIPCSQRRVDGAALLALLISLSAHASVIAVGWFVYRAVADVEPPRLELPLGFAGEIEGNGRGAPTIALLDRNMKPQMLVSAPPIEVSANPTEAPDGLPEEGFGARLELEGLSRTGSDSVIGPVSDMPSAPVRRRGGDGTGQTALVAAQSTGDAAATPAEVSGDGGGGDRSGKSGATLGIPEGVPQPLTQNRMPRYPPDDLRAGIGGTVLLELEINERGKVTHARILTSSGRKSFDQAALDVAPSWRFSPARLNGRPIAVTVPNTVNFIPPKP